MQRRGEGARLIAGGNGSRCSSLEGPPMTCLTKKCLMQTCFHGLQCLGRSREKEHIKVSRLNALIHMYAKSGKKIHKALE